MENVFIRLDGRMAHGIVMTTIVPSVKAKKVYVVHDYYAKDPVMSMLQKMAASSASVVLDVVTAEQIAQLYMNKELGKVSSCVVFGTVEYAHDAYLKGFKFDSMQIGTISGAPGKIVVSKGVNMNQNEANMLRELLDAGVDIYCQEVPSDSPIPLIQVLEKVKL